MSTHSAKRVRFARTPAPPAPRSGSAGASAPSVPRAAPADRESAAPPPLWPVEDVSEGSSKPQIYRDLAAIDTKYRTPASLIKILANAASRYPDVADEISQLSKLMLRERRERRERQERQDPSPSPAPAEARPPKQHTGTTTGSTTSSNGSAKRRQSRTAEPRTASPPAGETHFVPAPAPSPPPPIPAKPPGSTGAKRKRTVAQDKDFTPYLRQMEDLMGWNGRYDRASDSAEARAAVGVGDKLERLTASIAKQLQGDDVTYATKRSGVTVIRDLLHAVFLTQGRMGRELRTSLYGPDDDLPAALETFTEEELGWLLTEDNGAWLQQLDEAAKDADGYGLGGGLKAAQALCLGYDWKEKDFGVIR